MSLSKQLSVPLSKSTNALFVDNVTRFCLIPFLDEDILKLYKEMQGIIWVVEDVSLKSDNWDEIDKDARHFLKHILGFFATADGIVNENLLLNLCSKIKQADVRAFYQLQMYVETVHAEMYGLLLQAYIKDPNEREELLRASTEIPSIKHKADWALRWINETAAKDDPTESDIAELLVAFAAVEGIFFSGSFCAIFWFKKQYKGKLPGLIKSNEFISKDEGKHTEGACLLIRKYLKHVLDYDKVKEIIISAVDAERFFVTKAVPVSMIGMSAESMSQYIEFVADRLFAQLGYPIYYNTSNPFDFMERISLPIKSNFFECDEANYSATGDHSRDVEFDIDC
jgi:ribonucleotide reductase beta subunit family protein with ferritin-like domain